MKIVTSLTGVVMVFISFISDCDAQVHKEVSFRGDVEIIKSREDYKGLRDEDQFIESELRLSAQARTTLITALRKGLDWAKINESKNLTFSKRITVISAKSSRYMSCCTDGGQFNRIQVVFVAKNAREYDVILYGDNNDVAFDIENPGLGIESFSSRKQIDDFIALLNKKPVDLNQVFK